MKLAALTLEVVIVSGLRLSYQQGTPFCPWEHAWPESILLSGQSQSCADLSQALVHGRCFHVLLMSIRTETYLLTQRCFPEAELSVFSTGTTGCPPLFCFM